MRNTETCHKIWFLCQAQIPTLQNYLAPAERLLQRSTILASLKEVYIILWETKSSCLQQKAVFKRFQDRDEFQLNFKLNSIINSNFSSSQLPDSSFNFRESIGKEIFARREKKMFREDCCWPLWFCLAARYSILKGNGEKQQNTPWRCTLKQP